MGVAYWWNLLQTNSSATSLCLVTRWQIIQHVRDRQTGDPISVYMVSLYGVITLNPHFNTCTCIHAQYFQMVQYTAVSCKNLAQYQYQMAKWWDRRWWDRGRLWNWESKKVRRWDCKRKRWAPFSKHLDGEMVGRSHGHAWLNGDIIKASLLYLIFAVRQMPETTLCP